MWDMQMIAPVLISSASHEALGQWRVLCLPGEGNELKIRSLIERHEAKMRTAGREATIRAVWVELANAAASGEDPS
jgi:hypothetical protein